MRTRDPDPIADVMGETIARHRGSVGPWSVPGRREHGPEVEDHAVRPVVAVEQLRREVLRITTDLLHGAVVVKGETIVGALHVERHGLVADHVEIEVAAQMPVEEPDERADGGAAAVVLRTSEEQGAPAFPVPKIHVVAEGRADHASIGRAGEHHLGLRIVPGAVRTDSDRHAGAHRRHRAGLGEDLGVRTEADLEVRTPPAGGDHRLPEPKRLGRTGTQVRHVVADRLEDPGAGPGGERRIAVRGLLDHPLQHALDEGDARGLDGLEVHR